MKPDKATIERLEETLKDLLNKAVTGKLTNNLGICYQWQEAFNEGNDSQCYNLVAEFAKEWPESANPGNTVPYPISENDYYSRWCGPNLILRISLMRYILKRLRDWKRRTKE